MVWDVAGLAAGGAYSIGSDWAHGVDPTKSMVQDIRVLACEDTWQAKITMWGEAALHWAWTVFVPSRTEVFRKTVTGSYKCGFYLGLKWKSPIDLIPGTVFEAPNIYGRPFLRVSEVFAEISRPAVTGLFYLWAIGSAYEALATWQSIVYASEMCDLQANECLLKDGIGSFFNLGGTGEPNQYVVLHDPNGWHPAFSGFISVPNTNYVQIDAVGDLTACGNGCATADIYITGIGAAEGSPGTIIHLGPMAGGENKKWSLSWGGILSPTVVAIEGHIVQNAAPLDRSTLRCTRFTVTESPVPRPQQCIVWHPADP